MATTRALDNFYLSAEDLENTPSRKSGVNADTELRLRVYGCDRIQRAVVLLQLPQVVAATAQTLLHRFYYKRCLRTWHIRVRRTSRPAAVGAFEAMLR
jgi:cyclin L